MKKVIVFGDLPLATKVCEYINTRQDSKLMGIVIGNKTPNNHDPFENTKLLYDYAIENNIQIYNMIDLVGLYSKNSLDLGISARFSKMIKKECLELFKIGIVNFHGGLLPEYGGLYSSVHCLLNNETIGGGTIHWMDEKIDTGHIISRCEFNIKSDDTSFSIFQKTQIVLIDKFKEYFSAIISNQAPEITQEELIKRGYVKMYYNKDSLYDKKEIDIQNLNSKNDKLFNKEINKIKAFDFPGHEPSFMRLNDQKIYLRMGI